MKWCIFTILSLIITLNSKVFAQWNENYDPNTEIMIKGKIIEILNKTKGPVVLGIMKQDRVYYIVTAPMWYLEENRVNLRVGDELMVHGAKYFSHKGEFFLIARSIQNLSDGKLYSFRDQHFRPFWRGRQRFNLR